MRERDRKVQWARASGGMHLPATAIIPGRAMVLCVAGAAMCGCTSTGGESNKGAEGGLVHAMAGHAGPQELERLNQAFADRYVMRLSTVCDQILAGNTDEAQCRRIREMRASSAMSMYDIVTDRDPYMATVNLTVVVSLQRIAWAEEDNGERMFGSHGRDLKEAVQGAHSEVLDVARKVFSAEGLKTLDGLVRDWRMRNPNLLMLSNARFTDFMDSSEVDGATREKATGLFAQIDQAREAVDEVRALAERTLYLGKRMPLLLEWRTLATADDLSNNPRIVQATGDFHTVAMAVDRLPATLEAQRKGMLEDLGRERDALLRAFDQRQPAIDTTVNNVKETVSQTTVLARETKLLLEEMQRTAVSLQDLIKSGETIVGRYMPPPATAEKAAPAQGGGNKVGAGTAMAAVPSAAAVPGEQVRPFDIRDYTAALKEASQTARDLNEALISSGKLLDSAAWHDRIEEVNSAADGRVKLASEQSQVLVGEIFKKVYIALGALMLMLVGARLASVWLLRKTGLQKG